MCGVSDPEAPGEDADSEVGLPLILLLIVLETSRASFLKRETC
jgi:hypothetical protein